MATLDSDNFNRTFITLAGETSSGGNTWAENSAFSGVLASANTNTEVSGSGLIDSAWHYSGATPSNADYDVSLTITNVTSSNSSMVLVGRQSTNAFTGEQLGWAGGDLRWELREYTAGVKDTLGTDTGNDPRSNPQILKQSFSGTNLTCTYGGNTLFGGAVTVSLSSAGRAGIGTGDSATSRADLFLWEEAGAAGIAIPIVVYQFRQRHM